LSLDVLEIKVLDKEWVEKVGAPLIFLSVKGNDYLTISGNVEDGTLKVMPVQHFIGEESNLCYLCGLTLGENLYMPENDIAFMYKCRTLIPFWKEIAQYVFEETKEWMLEHGVQRYEVSEEDRAVFLSPPDGESKWGKLKAMYQS